MGTCLQQAGHAYRRAGGSTPVGLVVVGGGIVGLATALALTERYPGLGVTVLEKEAEVGAHQTGHNSGVIHDGIYYRPGSLKARLCIEGARRLYAFCEALGLPHARCGKVIVATTPEEVKRLEALHERGRQNGVPGLRRIGPEELRDLEPYAAGLRALHSPAAGIVDYRTVARAMAAALQERGARVMTGARVLGIRRECGEGYLLETVAGDLRARFLVNCAGLYADRVARMAGAEPGVRIIPFRGEYYTLKPDRRHLVRALIYPVPDPGLPFLGVHFTRTVHGEVEAGPNAVLALAREGYSRGRVRPDELWEALTYSGFRALARRHWRLGMYEVYRSISRRAFACSLQRLVPALRTEDLVPGGSGVRAQAVTPDGRLVDDFHVVQGPGALHVLNAPSPAATASLAIGEHLAGLAAELFRLAPGA
jgi:L-2-hydroxyglutarate oxidase LhgO